MPPYEEYWIGKGVNFDALWSDYEQGAGYIRKFQSLEVHLLELSFAQFDRTLPLFNLEAVLKTSKGVYHNLKHSHFSPAEYDRYGPLFVYDIARGSEKWRFLGELRPLLLFAIALWGQIRKGTARHKGEQIALIDGLQRRFPNSPLEDLMSYVDSLPGCEEQTALKKLYGQNLKSVKISASPFRGDIKQTERTLISLDDIDSNNGRKNI